MDSVATYWNDRALLEWQVELGATDAVQDMPVDRYALELTPPKPAAAAVPSGPPPIPEKPVIDAPAEAKVAAAGAADLAALQAAMQAYEHCGLKKGARNCVFGFGDPAARVMVLTEPPGREEDRAAQAFVGPAATLFDRMFAAINLTVAAADTAQAIYVAPVMPWRMGTMPAAADLAMMRPFLERHIALANPDVVILMGSTPCEMLLGRGGMTRLRGRWQEVLGRPALPMLPPAQLMKTPEAKRDAWADLLDLQARLRGTV